MPTSGIQWGTAVRREGILTRWRNKTLSAAAFYNLRLDPLQETETCDLIGDEGPRCGDHGDHGGTTRPRPSVRPVTSAVSDNKEKQGPGMSKEKQGLFVEFIQFLIRIGMFNKNTVISMLNNKDLFLWRTKHVVIIKAVCTNWSACKEKNPILCLCEFPYFDLFEVSTFRHLTTLNVNRNSFLVKISKDISQ